MRAIATFCLLLSALCSFSQKAKISVFVPIENAPVKKVNSFFHDSRGFMWMACREGLLRFDGYHYKAYNHCIINTDTIDFRAVSNIVEDQSGDLWIMQESGIFKYRVKEDSFQYFPFPDSLKINDDTFLMNDSKNVLWIGCFNGLYRFDKNKNQFHYYSTKTGIGSGGVMNIYETRNHKLYVANWEGGMSEYLPATDQFRNIPFRNIPWFAISCINEDSHGNIWVSGFYGKLYKFSNDSFIHVPNAILDENKYSGNFIDEDNNTLNFFIDKKNTIWLVRKHSVVEYNAESGKVYEYFPNHTTSPLNSLIYSGYYDRAYDILWIGTEEGPRKIFLKNWTEQYYVYPKLREHLIKNISFYNRNEFLLYSDRKFFRMNTEGALLMEMPYFERRFNNWAIVIDKTLKHDLVNDKTVQLDFMKGKIYEKPFVPDSILSRLLYKRMLIQLTDKERIFLSRNYFVYYNQASEIVKVLQIEQFPESDFTFTGTLKLNADSILLIGPDKDFIYSISKNIIYHHKAFPFFINTLTFSNDTAWIISDHDLVRYIPKISEIKYFPLSNIAHDISKISIDKHQNLWISDNKMICHFDVKKEVFQFYKIGNMLDFHSVSFDDEKNRMLIGGYDHILICNPDSLLHSIKPASLHFTRFFINNAEYSPANFKNVHADFFYLNKITLKPKQSNFSIEFSSLEYNFPESIIYEYLLEGIDATWCKVQDGSNLATYKKIPSGSYVFRLRRESDPGSEIQLKITLLPYWWETWWFKIVVSILLLSCFILIYIFRTHRMRRQNIKLEKIIKQRTAELERQKEEITVQAENMKEINVLLEERNEEVVVQAEELTKLNATKDKFFSIIAHDLKNPFQAITGLSDLLLMDYKEYNEDKVKNFISMIRESSSSASVLLQNLLQWARSQTNSIEIKPEVFNLYDLVKDVFMLLMPNANSKNISLQNKVGIDTGLEADRNMIHTVIRNLVDNSIKYTPDNGVIVVSEKKGGRELFITISDNGVGMNDEISSNLFKIDKHRSTPGTKGESGTGLGLIICKYFVEKNKGNISIESLAGKGTSFIITLPAVENVSAGIISDLMPEGIKKVETSIPELTVNEFDQSEIKETDSELPADEKPMMLVVDDDEKIRVSMSNYFAKSFRIISCENGKDGLDRALEECPDIIVSDVNMPLMDGFELCAKIKSDERTSHIPLILLTANTGEIPTMKGYETGADDYVSKPFSLKVLDTRLKNLIESRSKLREIFSKQLPSIPRNSGLSKINQAFLEKVITIIEKNMDDSDLDAEMIVREIAMSRANLYRKLKAITNQSVHEFIKIIRLKKAAELISQGEKNISEVAYMVGFKDHSYFSHSFKKLFGKTPSDYIG